MLLNDLIKNKAKQTRQEAVSFENALASEFRILTAKSGENLLKVKKQVNLYTDISEKENNIANSISVISAMMSKNSLLERLVYSKIEQKVSVFPKKTDEDEIKRSASSPTPTKLKQKKPAKPKFSAPPAPQRKLAEGGVVSATGIERKKNVDPNIIPYADTLSLPLQASGIAALTTLGEFIKGTGALGGFFTPYLKNVVSPFALALGVSQNMINTLLGGPVHAATLDLKDQQRYFGKTWGKFLNDSNFVDKFIDRIMDPNDPNKPPGYVPANWKDDPEFTAELNRVAQKFNINANDLLAVMLVETGGTLNPAIRNPKSDATGLIQFIPSTARGLGTTVDELAKMSRAQQMKYVEKYFDGKLPQGASGGQIYAAVFLPAFIKEEVLTVRGEAYYNANVGLDYNSDGKITRSDLDAHVEAKKKQYKLERGGGIGTGLGSIAPYLMSGSEGGYDAIIQGIKVTLHGDEVVVPSDNGFQVYPIKNRRYDIFEDPLGVTKRWKEIAKGSNTQNVSSFSSGGSAEFWKIAALASKEDSLHPQGQADVAQSLYNRAAMGSYPGGKSISAIITAPGQYQPTFGNAATWNAIRDRKSAIAAAGNAQKVDMAVKSITNPSLQKEAQRFIGGRTDFQGESQKPHMKSGDVTRGKGYNFHGWFYDARLPKPASVPKMVASQTTASVSKEKINPKVVINRAASQSQPNLMQQVQSAITYIPNIIFNPHRLKKELNMRRAR